MNLASSSVSSRESSFLSNLKEEKVSKLLNSGEGTAFYIELIENLKSPVLLA